MNEPGPEPACKCSLRTRLVGDGCEVCNPQREGMTHDEFHQMLEAHGIVFVGDAAWRVAQLAAAVEREACAKVCESIARDTYGMTSMLEYGECAAAIRARSMK